MFIRFVIIIITTITTPPSVHISHMCEIPFKSTHTYTSIKTVAAVVVVVFVVMDGAIYDRSGRRFALDTQGFNRGIVSIREEFHA